MAARQLPVTPRGFLGRRIARAVPASGLALRAPARALRTLRTSVWGWMLVGDTAMTYEPEETRERRA